MMSKQHPRTVWLARMTALAAVVSSFGIRSDANPAASDDPIIQSHIGRQIDLTDANKAIVAQADLEKRELSTAERKQITDNCNEVDRLQDEIDLRARVTAHQSRTVEPTQRQAGPVQATQHQQQQGPVIQTVALTQPGHRAQARGNHGFNNVADYCMAVRQASLRGGAVDQRLVMAAASTIGTEGVGSDGGFAVPPDFLAAIQVLVMGEGSLLAMADNYPTNSNRVTVPTDETTAWGTSGVRAYWSGEAAALTQSKPALKDHTTVLHKLHALVPLSDELVSDAPFVASLVTRKAGDALQYAMNNAIINGTGVAQPLGILNAPALVTAAAEGSQVAATIHALNIIAMWGRVPGAVRARTVWLCNQDVEVQLMKLGLQVGPPTSGAATGGMPLYMPPGGLSATPYGTLLGRPVITTEACKTLGTVGDIILAYMGGYFAPIKGGGPTGAVSMHLWFDQDLVAYKWTMRVGGQPWLQAAIARASGSNTLSHFVALATRS